MNTKLILALLLSTTWIGCKETSKDLKVDTPSYFDISAFVESILSINGGVRSATKTIHINDLSESQTKDRYDIANDLSEFSKKNIALPKYMGKYDINKNQLNKTTYTTLDDKLPIKKMTVTRNDSNKIISVEIHEVKKTAILTQHINYELTPDKGYKKMACDSMVIVGKKCKGYEIEFI